MLVKRVRSVNEKIGLNINRESLVNQAYAKESSNPVTDNKVTNARR
jgi:hypothetical protein